MSFYNLIFLKNVSRALSSNLLAIISSVFVILILPKYIGLQDYGYWQLYLFYASYVGILHLGWSDGVYLKLGGKAFKDIGDEPVVGDYFLFCLCQLAVAISIFYTSLFFEGEKSLVVKMVSVCLFLTNIRSYTQSILQACNKIKEYSAILMVEKLLIIISIALLILFKKISFQNVILVDLFARSIALLLSVSSCRAVIFCPWSQVTFNFSQVYENILAGSKLMFSFVVGLLIFGVVRYSIEQKWGIKVFGEVSLSLSLASLVVVFVNSIGIVLFPMLRSVSEDQLSGIYKKIRLTLLVILILTSTMYFPMKLSLEYWLPEFDRSIKYLAIIFPLLLFETKIAILTNTYMKAMRFESNLLIINIFILILCITLSLLITPFFESVHAYLYIMLFVSMVRYMLSDYFISKNVKAINKKLWSVDVGFCLIFMYLIKIDEYVTLLCLTLVFTFLFLLNSLKPLKSRCE